MGFRRMLGLLELRVRQSQSLGESLKNDSNSIDTNILSPFVCNVFNSSFGCPQFVGEPTEEAS
jgi:hypothetical protein